MLGSGHTHRFLWTNSETSKYGVWYYKDSPIDSIDFAEYPTFVYRITNLLTGKFYIGYKQSYFQKTKQVKGKKKKIKVESDWKTYWSSSEELQRDVLLHGEDSFRRDILYLCRSVSMASYLEMREQIDHRVLERPDETYNGIINARVSRMHLKNVLKYISEVSGGQDNTD